VQGTGSYSSGVAWSATGGTISATGVFAPSGSGNATIKATSTQDNTKSGTATVSVNAPVTFAHGALLVSPPLYPSSISSPVTISIWLPDPQTVSSSIIAYETDINGVILSTKGVLKDDGLNGDVTAGDKIYTLQFTVLDSSPTIHYYSVSVGISGVTTPYLSEVQSITSVPVIVVTDLVSYQQGIQDSMNRLLDGVSSYQSIQPSGATTLNESALDSYASYMVSVMGNIQQLSAYDSVHPLAMRETSDITSSTISPRSSSFSNFWASVLSAYGLGAMATKYNEIMPEKEAFLGTSFNASDPAIKGIMLWIANNQIYLGNCQAAGMSLSDQLCRSIIWGYYVQTSSAGVYAAAQSSASSALISEYSGLAETGAGQTFESVSDLSPTSNWLVEQAAGGVTDNFVDNITTPSGRQVLAFGTIAPGQTTTLPSGTHDIIIAGGSTRSETSGIAAPANGVIPITFTGSSKIYSPPAIWPMQGQNPQKSGSSNYLGLTAAPTSTKWTFKTSSSVVGDITVSAEGTIYFASDKLYALNPNGTQFASPVVLSKAATGPAIDDLNGYVYVAVGNTDGSFDVMRYSKSLTNATDIIHVTPAYYGLISPLILGTDGTFYFMSGRFPSVVYSVGTHSWSNPVCPGEGGPIPSSAINAPAIGTDGSIYVMCSGNGLSGLVTTGLNKLNPITGAQLAFSVYSYGSIYSSGATEPVIDTLQHIHSGYEAGSGITFLGGYDEWDSNLNLVSTPCMASCTAYTTGRAAVLSDGNSTVRIGYGYNTEHDLTASGKYTWTIVGNGHPYPSFTSIPTVDAFGHIFIGTATGIAQMSPTNGSFVWTYSTGDSITTQPAISNTGNLYVGSSSGNVYAFGP
jgi:hypothetical protein